MAHLSRKEVKEAVRYNDRQRFALDVIEDIQKLIGAESDGIIGPQTCQGIAYWQEDNRLDADGKLGPKTRKALEAALAGQPSFTVLHAMPDKKGKWGYDHLPLTWHKADPQFQLMTGNGSYVSGHIRMVSGYWNDGPGGSWVFSRGPDSLISLDEISLSFAHWHAGTAPEDIFIPLARELSPIAEWAWGADVVAKMAQKDWLEDYIGPDRGKMPFHPRYNWLAAGWHEISRHPDVIRLCVKAWLKDYLRPARKIMQVKGWKLAQTEAGIARMINSRGNRGAQRILAAAIERLGTGDETKVLPVAYLDEDFYDKPKRWDRILAMAEFRGEIPESYSEYDLEYGVDVIRVDGSVPNWVRQGLF